MKKLILASTLFFGISTLGGSVWADTYFVMETSGSANHDDAASVTELVKSAVQETSGNQITNEASKAKFTLQPKLLKLGSSYVMTLDKVSSGRIIFSSQLKAASVEELDGVSARLVRSVVAQIPVKGDARIEDVTESETNAGTNRKQAQRHWYFGFGPYGSSNMGVGGVMYNIDIAYAWGLGNDDIKIFYDGTAAFNTTTTDAAAYNAGGFSDFGIGGNFFLNDMATAPFFEADLGFGGVSGTSGFAIGGGFGYTFFRTSSVNLELLARYSILLAQDPLGAPSVFGLRLGIYF